MKLNGYPAETLLHLLQRITRSAAQVGQVHSSLITHGHLFISDQWINTLLFNALIRAFLTLSRPRLSVAIFSDMLNHRALPNSHTFPSVLKATAALTESCDVSSLASSLNAQCVRRGVLDDPYVRTSLIAAYGQTGDTRSASKVFDEMPHPCVVSYNAMLDAFGRSGDMNLARSLFSSMPERDVYSWTSVISGYASNGCSAEAISLFAKMMADEDVKSGLLTPTEATFVSVLSSCANVDGRLALYQGKEIHGYMVRHEKEMSAVTGTALIAFYGKRGCLTYATKVFRTIPPKRVCTWNAMISSLASNGRETQALQMFEKMKSLSLKPNEVTFVGVLSACARTKMVDFGLELFHSMSRDYRIIPRMEHYGCLVDLLGRAGFVREAYELVRGMPFEADASVLGSLLGSCRVHGFVDLGDEVCRRLLEVRPRHCGQYVLLSSIYAGAEIWDRAASLRTAMVHAGIKKHPAFSIADGR